MQAYWHPDWYALDMPLQVGRSENYLIAPEPDSNYRLHNSLSEIPDDVIIIRAEVLSINHPIIGKIQEIRIGLDYVFILENENIITVDAEEEPGSIVEDYPKITQWDFDIVFSKQEDDLNEYINGAIAGKTISIEGIIQIIKGSLTRNSILNAMSEKALQKLGHQTIPAWIELLNSRETSDQYYATIELGKFGPTASEAAPKLLSCAEYATGRVLGRAIVAAEQVGAKKRNIRSILRKKSKAEQAIVEKYRKAHREMRSQTPVNSVDTQSVGFASLPSRLLSFFRLRR